MKRTATTIAMSLLAALLACVPARAAITPDEQARILADASAAFAKGASQIDTDRAAGLESLRAAAAGFSRLIDEGGIENGRLYYNLANAQMLQGDLGRAIVNYRRAERLIPGDVNLVQNLAHARSRVATRIDASADTQVRSAVLGWHDRVPARVRFWAFAACNAAAWGIAALGFFRLVRGRTWWAVAVLGLGVLALGASLGASLQADGPQDAVIVQPSVVGRKGPDASAYQPSFDEPLNAGVEGAVIEQRPGWSLLRLRDGRQTWLPEGSVELVNAPSR